MARPKKQENELRSVRLPAVRLTHAERLDAEARAERAGLELSEFVRARVFSDHISPRATPIEASMLTELNRIGNNVNQVARALNRGRDEDPHHIDHVLHELHTTLKLIGQRFGS